MTDVRAAAARVLMAVERRESTLASAIDEARARVLPVDRALLQELTTGTLRWRAAVDAVIAAAARRSVRDLDPDVLAVLRLGTYQLRYLTRVPAHAVVNSAVSDIRSLRRSSAAPLVNAVLRSIIRRGPAIALPARPDEGAGRDAWERYLSITLSHPLWLVRRWLDRYGPTATEAWCIFNNTAPGVTVRAAAGDTVDSLLDALDRAGIVAERARYVEDAIVLPAGVLGRLPAELAGRLRAQDEGAQLIARLADAREGDRVLDLCAAPGGKTLLLAGDMRLTDSPDSAPLIAADHRPGRIALLRATFDKAGRSVPIVRLDARQPLPFSAAFDLVLLDAPCSGLGTLRREPDLKWARTAQDLPELAAAQATMIAAAAEAVAPGGRLVYATCSSEPDENVEVVEAFLERDRRFVRSTATPARIAGQLMTANGALVTRPDSHGLEAFYAAVLVRSRTA